MFGHLALGPLAVLIFMGASVSGCQESFNGANCVTSPRVFVSMQGTAEQPLPLHGSVRLTLPIGSNVTVRFAGPCPDGARLAIRGTGTADTNSFSDISSGMPTQTWAPTTPGTVTLAAEWGCSGPIPCPLAELGQIVVVTPPPNG
jgi:hypothetical protein